jgi:hypothetical protein
MTPLVISQVDLNDKKQVRQFVRFPFDLYRGCKQWVPPLLSDAYSALNPQKHPFYQHSQAVFYTAWRGHKMLGRIAALRNNRYIDYTGNPKAFFGLFDCIDDPEACRALVATAAEWGRGQGLQELAGPRTLSMADSTGVLVKGFEHRAALNVPYNYEYYDALLTGAGLVKESDTLSGYLPGSYRLDARVRRIAERVRERRGLWIKTFKTKDEMRQHMRRVADVVLESFRDNHEYYPLTEDEIHVMGESIITIADPRLIKIVMHGEDVVGFVFSYHDVGPALQKSGGRLFPLGWLYVLLEQRRANWVNINGLGLLEGHRGVGADALLFSQLEDSIHEFGFKHADLVAIHEHNIASRGDMEALGVDWYKAHRNYTMPL